MQNEILLMQQYEENEKRYAKDLENIKRYYPKEYRGYDEEINEECDRLEYDGPVMYAEIPDQVQIERIARKISDKHPEKDCCFPIIMTMLLNEMYSRRCRRCRRKGMFFGC